MISIAGARAADRFRPVALSTACFVLFGLLDLAIFNYPRWDTALWPVLVLFFLIGVPGGVGYAAMVTLFQIQMAERLRGRAFAVLTVGQAVAAMVGAAVAGTLGQTVSVVDLLTAQGAGYVLAGILMRVMAGRGPDSVAEPAPIAASRPDNMSPTPNQTVGPVRCSRVSPDRIDQYADFTTFAEACQLRMLRSAYLICGDRHLAEDLLQSALVKVALHWRQVREGNPEAYLRTILYRDAVSWWRRHRRETLVAELPEGHGRDDGMQPAQLRVIFAQALARLTPKQRAILVLRFFEDHTEARTAAVLGVAVGTVKSQTAVALRRLRELAPELSDLVRQDSEGGRR